MAVGGTYTVSGAHLPAGQIVSLTVTDPKGTQWGSVRTDLDRNPHLRGRGVGRRFVLGSHHRWQQGKPARHLRRSSAAEPVALSRAQVAVCGGRTGFMLSRRSTSLARACMVALVGVTGIAIAGCSSSSKTTTGTTAPHSVTTIAGPHTLLQTAAYDHDLSTLATALNVGGLVSTTSARGPYTLFAPDNDAFARLPHGRLATLLAAASKQELARLLTYHLVRGRLTVKDLKPGTLKTVNGATMTVSMDGDKVVLTDSHGTKATIVHSDIATSNGMIQVVDAVLRPPVTK